jgi:hypothetical protein
LLSIQDVANRTAELLAIALPDLQLAVDGSIGTLPIPVKNIITVFECLPGDERADAPRITAMDWHMPLAQFSSNILEGPGGVVAHLAKWANDARMPNCDRYALPIEKPKHIQWGAIAELELGLLPVRVLVCYDIGTDGYVTRWDLHIGHVPQTPPTAEGAD